MKEDTSKSNEYGNDNGASISSSSTQPTYLIINLVWKLVLHYRGGSASQLTDSKRRTTNTVSTIELNSIS